MPPLEPSVSHDNTTQRVQEVSATPQKDVNPSATLESTNATPLDDPVEPTAAVEPPTAAENAGEVTAPQEPEECTISEATDPRPKDESPPLATNESHYTTNDLKPAGSEMPSTAPAPKTDGLPSPAGSETPSTDPAPKPDEPSHLKPEPTSAEGSAVTSPSHSEPPLESSSTSSTVGTEGSSQVSSPEKLGQSMMVRGNEPVDSGADPMSMSLSAGMGEASGKKKKQRQQSMHEKLSRSISSVGAKVKRVATQHSRRPPVPRESSPSLMSPVTMRDWDPTCLLEELYADFHQAARKNASGECARHYGYLEKLPKNATKASVGKGWKRRYFRVMDDKLFYYKKRTEPKALGFVRLSNSRLTQNDNQIHIQEKAKGGQSIMVRGRDKDEASDWYRALGLEAAHPTPLAPVLPTTSPATASSQPDQDQPSILIIDIGAASVRAGFAGKDAYPEMFFPAVASIDSSSYEPLASGIKALAPNNRYDAHQVYPRKHNLRMDRHDVNLELKALELIVETVILELDVEPEVTDLILTLPPTTPEQQRNDLAASLFEAFLFAAICFQDQCLLSLYSYNTTSGVVVNIGDHIDVVPIIDGYKIESGVSHLPHGGNAITEYLSRLVTHKGLRYFSETEKYIMRLIKEKLCYLSQSYDEDVERCDASSAMYTHAADLDRYQLPDHRKVVALDVECFKAPEGLFRPSLWGKDVTPLHELVWKAIQACPIDQRREMAKKIYLSGATCQLTGLQERLQIEVSQVATTGLAIQVHTNGNLQHAAFLGASVLATLGSFQNYLVTREEFSSLGFDALKKWSTEFV